MDQKSDLKNQDELLLRKIKAGDERAFELVFKNYYPHLVLLAQKYLGDRDLSESTVQSVFVKMWETRNKVEIRSLKGFLVVAVRNRCTNELKHRQVVREYEKKHEQPETTWMTFNENVYLQRINNVIDASTVLGDMFNFSAISLYFKPSIRLILKIRFRCSK